MNRTETTDFLTTDFFRCDRQIRPLLRQCGQHAAQSAQSDFEIFEKGQEDYYTSIDTALDHMLTEGFGQHFPHDGLITEENPSSSQQFSQSFERLWCVDPLDGTEDFIHRRPDYSVMAGLLERQRPRAGWIYAPSYDVSYAGALGVGAFISRADQLPQAIVAQEPALGQLQGRLPVLIGHRDQRRYGAAIAAHIPEVAFANLGSFGLKVMEVVLGRAVLYLYLNQRVKLWDTVGPLAIAEAAGLICCDLAGNPLQFTTPAVDPQTLVHQQSIVVGWPNYMHALRPRLEAAVRTTVEGANT